MPLELAQVVAELVEAVSFLGEMEGCEDGLVDLLGGPAADMTACERLSGPAYRGF